MSKCTVCGGNGRIAGGSCPACFGTGSVEPRADLQLFEVEGRGWRFGQDPDGTPWVVASDVAKTFGHRDAATCVRVLDEQDGEKSTRIVRTPTGQQEQWVVFEDGLWELIFLSRKPEAKRLKKRVKEILREIRETGRYEAAPRFEIPQTYAEALELAARQARQIEEIEAEKARLEGPAHSWNVLASGHGDYSVRDAAKILNRDPAIKIGERSLFTHLDKAGWTFRSRADGRWRAYQRQVDLGRLSELPQHYEHPTTGEIALAPPQIRITVKGLQELHRQLGGIAPLRLDEQLAIEGGT